MFGFQRENGACNKLTGEETEANRIHGRHQLISNRRWALNSLPVTYRRLQSHLIFPWEIEPILPDFCYSTSSLRSLPSLVMEVCHKAENKCTPFRIRHSFRQLETSQSSPKWNIRPHFFKRRFHSAVAIKSRLLLVDAAVLDLFV